MKLREARNAKGGGEGEVASEVDLKHASLHTLVETSNNLAANTDRTTFFIYTTRVDTIRLIRQPVAGDDSRPAQMLPSLDHALD